ncbi:HEPN domain-containing protein [Flavihumibacter sp. CACIAM 22H1]|uniref:HEPN domain-containing protein n=1 Tax=Flavihumibacter sp. CACIAM 22H1 TaxID=1812911 RepID=UPI0007A8CE4B|nr:HEPN domain-containing protein [Flavihumibacter sp. CACIAM 22H1]KYP13381.1 MAG: hypothetical protein A1D16_03825 [Flavihumibacter sp. CACIAM 22H1]
MVSRESVRSVQQASNLPAIIQLLVMAMAPSKIFLLEHGAVFQEGAVVYRELLVVLPASNSSKFVEMEPLAELISQQNRGYYCSFYAECRVVEGLKRGELFFTLNFQKEKLVFDSYSMEYTEADAVQISLLKAQQLALFYRAIRKSYEFYQSALLLGQRNISPICCFFLHQAIELCLRAIIQHLGGYEKRTHQLRALKKQVIRVAPEMISCLSEESAIAKQRIDVLEAAYLNARYSYEFSLPIKLLGELIEEVEQTLLKARELMQAKLAPAY